jgi:hypothetical protein
MTQTFCFRAYAVQRMFERAVSVKKVLNIATTGALIEDYSLEMQQPGGLMLGFQGKRPIHVVISKDSGTNQTIIVTAYIPHPDKWTKDFKVRRS